MLMCVPWNLCVTCLLVLDLDDVLAVVLALLVGGLDDANALVRSRFALLLDNLDNILAVVLWFTLLLSQWQDFVTL